MVTEIINGISIKLNQLFGDEFHIHTNQVEQGIKEPCFFICMLESSQENFLGHRYKRLYPFDIHYFPKRVNKLEMLTIGENLMEELRFVTLENQDIISGSDIRYEIVNNVLHFYITYTLVVNIYKQPIEKMGEILVNAEKKNR